MAYDPMRFVHPVEPQGGMNKLVAESIADGAIRGDHRQGRAQPYDRKKRLPRAPGMKARTRMACIIKSPRRKNSPSQSDVKRRYEGDGATPDQGEHDTCNRQPKPKASSSFC